MTAKTTKPTPETLCKVLDFLANVSPILADAMRAVGYAPGTVFLWAKLANEGDPRFLIRWPDPEGAEINFAAGIVLARSMQCAAFEATLRRDVTQGHPRVLRTPAGEVIYEQDHKLIAQWEGDADAARTIGGIADPFYVHDQDGARVPVIVFDPAPAMLRTHLARSVLGPQFNPGTNVSIDNRVSGVMTISKATAQGSPPPYARQKPEMASPADTPLRQDLLKRLADLRANGGAANPRPTHQPVYTGSGRPDTGPPECKGDGKRRVKV
jgi:hypothetical protein